jgi:YegS/Rv2252/BmrU family lipid kinase
MSHHKEHGRIVLLGNPASGRGRGAAALEAALRELHARGLRPDLLRTEAPGHAVELARKAAEAGADLLLVSGGDGTVRDVAEGLSGTDVPIGILPGGTGNDLARTLALPRDPARAVEVALGNVERALDRWRWNDTLFVNIAGVGLDAAVAGAVNRRFRRLRGTLAYVTAAFMTLPRFKPLQLHLTWPGGEWSGRTWVAAFANAQYYGGGMQMAPAAVVDDGLLDIIVFEDVSKAELLLQLPRMFSGTHIRHPRVRSFRAASARVEAAHYEATIDGELIDATPATITRAPGRLRVRAPAPGG